MLSHLAPLLLSALPCAGGPRVLPTPVQGIVLGLHDTDARRSYARSVAEIAGTGANTISLLTLWNQASTRSPVVGEGASTPAQLAEAITLAHDAGLAVLVAPTLRVEQVAAGQWRGTLTPPDWGAWFASYRSRLRALALLAERHRVEALLVGSELCSSESREADWRALIAELRGVFRGQLIYQANWDHRAAPRFLDALDLIGANAYFELAREQSAPSVAELVAAWQPHRADLTAWAKAWKRPLILTEVGYPSVIGGAGRPWDYTSGAAVDLDTQRRAYQAFFEVWAAEPATQGWFFYDWWGEGGPADGNYTPRGKPAEVVLRDGFRRQRSAP